MANVEQYMNATIVGFGEWVQGLRRTRGMRGLLRAVVDFEQASASPAFKNPRYYTAKSLVPPQGSSWVTTFGDPEAGKVNRSKKMAVVLGIGVSALRLLDERLQAEGIDTEAAVAYDLYNVPHAGVLSEGFGPAPEEFCADEEMLAAAMRDGPDPFSVTLGRFDIKTRTLYVPPGVVRLAHSVPTTTSLPKNFPGVPLG